MARLFPLPVLALSAFLLAGCGVGRVPPTLTEAEVVVTINGQPLPNALVTLTPASGGYGGEAIATGVTDESGLARLSCGEKAGASVGPNKVTVVDAPPPEAARGDDAAAQAAAEQYRKSLKNRPIPPQYATLAKSDATLDIKPGQKEYKLALKR
jgi:hypothetical protein